MIQVREHWEGRSAEVSPSGVRRYTTRYLVTSLTPLTRDEAFAAVPGTHGQPQDAFDCQGDGTAWEVSFVTEA